jgi:hypothetical protein
MIIHFVTQSFEQQNSMTIDALLEQTESLFAIPGSGNVMSHILRGLFIFKTVTAVSIERARVMADRERIHAYWTRLTELIKNVPFSLMLTWTKNVFPILLMRGWRKRSRPRPLSAPRRPDAGLPAKRAPDERSKRIEKFLSHHQSFERK